jgi:hypothetical protein
MTPTPPIFDSQIHRSLQCPMTPPHLLYPTAKFHWWGSLEIAVLVSRLLFALIVGWGPSELLQIILVCHHKSLSKFICLTACAQYSSFAACLGSHKRTDKQPDKHACAHTQTHTFSSTDLNAGGTKWIKHSFSPPPMITGSSLSICHELYKNLVFSCPPVGKKGEQRQKAQTLAQEEAPSA